MKHLLKAIAFVLVFVFAFFLVVYSVPDQFEQAYQRAIVRQYDYYRTIKGHKIVFIGESGLSFGLNLDYMEELSGLPCAILGNHYGEGLLFQLNMAKSNLKPGDTAVIVYTNYTMPPGEAELLLSGIGKRIDLYRFFPKELMGKIIFGFPSYFRKNLDYWRKWGYHPLSPYFLPSYDERGNMILPREECLLPEDYTQEAGDHFGWADFWVQKRDIEPDFVNSLNKFVYWCRRRDVKVLFTIPCYYEKAIPDGYDEMIMEEFDNALRVALDGELISHSRDYIFPREYMYDTAAHCNTIGANHRTELLYRDLSPYMATKE
ncbi:MAG: hypothetical protein IJG40_09945 [Oscillospiraceae bacterium]|nr:hypothetical protein [Oscillospiraceae bacterium]